MTYAHAEDENSRTSVKLGYRTWSNTETHHNTLYLWPLTWRQLSTTINNYRPTDNIDNATSMPESKPGNSW